jgi:hypothetical protein
MREPIIDLAEGKYNEIDYNRFFDMCLKEYKITTREQIDVMIKYKSLLRINAIQAIQVLLDYIKVKITII